MTSKRLTVLTVLLFILTLTPWGQAETIAGQPVSEDLNPKGWGSTIIGSSETALLRSLWLGSLSRLTPDSTDAVGDDPRAAKLGHRLFFDTRLSANGKVACASCHQPERYFSDDRALAQGVGTTTRKAMTIVGTAYNPWFFWDGRKDSLWSQALGPLESAVEHGGTRLQYVHLIVDDPLYRAEYQALFGPLPDVSNRTRFPETAGPVEDPRARAAWEAMTAEDRHAVNRVFVHIGKAIAAYERLLMPGPSRFDDYVQALLKNDQEAMRQMLSEDEVAGMRLFIGKAQCVRCHNGPLLTNHEFHNTGVPAAQGLPSDHGRREGIQKARTDRFNCLGPYSDAGDCAELRFARTGQVLDGAFKTPSLRNVAEMGPYMHAGQFATLKQVLTHYNRAAPGPLGHSELAPLHLSEIELVQLEAFLNSLSAPPATAPEWLTPPE